MASQKDSRRSTEIRARFVFHEAREVIQARSSTQVQDAYFFDAWAPLLGGAKFLFILKLREHVERAKIVEANGGLYQWPTEVELAASCGISDRTIRSWFEESAQDYLHIFVQTTTHAARSTDNQRLKGRFVEYEVQHQTPLTPEDYARYLGVPDEAMQNPHVQGAEDLFAHYPADAPVVVEAQNGRNFRSADRTAETSERQKVPVGTSPPTTHMLSTSSPQNVGRNFMETGGNSGETAVPTYNDQIDDNYYEEGSDQITLEELAQIKDDVARAFDPQGIDYIRWPLIALYAQQDLHDLQSLLTEDFVEAHTWQDILKILHTCFTRCRRKTDTIRNPLTYFDGAVRQALRLPKRGK